MAHVRTQIRQAVKAVLEAAMPGHNVFASRKRKINAAELPMIDMRFLNENSEFQNMGSDVQMRTASLYIRNIRAGDGDLLDDLLDDDAVLIEHAMEAAERLGGLLVDVALVQTNFSDSEEDTAKTIADVVLRYDVMYRVSAGSVEIARG